MTTTAPAADLELSLAGVPLDLSLDELLDLAVPGVPADDDFAFTLFHESDGEDSPRASAVDDHMDVAKQLPTMANSETETVTFVEKTYYMVNTCASRLVCWNATGMGFFILDAAAFARDVLPEFFKHRNLHAFVTELTLHGFRKTVRRHKTRAIECLEFRHAHFVRGDASQLRKIARRSSAPSSPLSAASSPSSVLDEAMASDGEDGDDDAEDECHDSAGESMGDLKSEISELKDEVQQTQQLFDKLIGALVHHNNAEAASAQMPVHPFMMCPPPAFAMFGMAPFAPGMHPGFFHPMSFAMGAVSPAVAAPAIPSPADIDVEDDDFMAEFFPTLE